jgi:hypothetical protein
MIKAGIIAKETVVIPRGIDLAGRVAEETVGGAAECVNDFETLTMRI